MIGKVLIVATSGVAKERRQTIDENASSMLDPKWVAAEAVALSSGRFKYKFAKLLGNPAAVEVVDHLDNNFLPIGN
ncbi:hypothetical protein [Phaeobacter sp. C3_T13_0]|uniref:hypothetical protein n=1 Tax=Phaeobacter cretensis TaxID=3342641 RepID=UPI0039BCD717